MEAVTQQQENESTDYEITLSVEEMRDQLDSLWETYLSFLDNYDQAQRRLNEHLSSGFFSLAQANFQSSSRTRYGQDFYDDRMQARRLVHVKGNVDNGLELSIVTSPVVVISNETEPSASTVDQTSQSHQQPTPPTTPPFESQLDEPCTEGQDTDDPADTPKDAASQPPSTRTVNCHDPLRWFGILTPPNLRACQKSFVAAVEMPCSGAINASRGMRRTEADIRKLRKAIRRSEKSHDAEHVTKLTSND